ncbi:zinc finger MYM-type protein 2-like [Sitodiplosis mosellana]|uniref:zinc finger MYM-type protein 2-like n=1 Tax=Sitodiplosis mosellana TaxID=263140 RepID=UPI002443CC23|nr:zinc finger MYM-type protein 2-like [Sitodiplosis mosellana]XP_055319579.1 zinc finger MYM-type protein 2-like [Sitodiplosis mosellana]
MSQINLNYCTQCSQIDIERVYNCRWLNFNFCRLKCLQQYIDRIAPNCDVCKKRLNNDRIHLRDDVKNCYAFVCDECFEERTPLAFRCYCCANKCYKGFEKTWDLTTSGLISKYVCSDECRSLSLTSGGQRKRLASCSECDGQATCVRTVQNGIFQSICCAKCLDTVENKQTEKFETCYHCSSKFTNDCQNAYIIREGGTGKEFCTELCMQSYLREDSATAICCICRHRMRFYDCIRRKCDDRCFCSLKCATSAETSIELLRRNDERCYLKNLNLKCATCNPELEFDDSIEDYILLDKSTSVAAVTASDQVSNGEYSTVNGRSGNEMVILNQIRTYDDLEGLITAPEVRECTPIQRCGHCQRIIKRTQSFMQWGYLEFCNNICYERFMYDDRYRCGSCSNDCGSCIGPNVHIIGNRMYCFCSEMCEKTFFGLMKFCRFCRNTITTMNHSDGFCQSTCRTRFKELYENCGEFTEKSCYQCLLTKPVDIFLQVNGVMHTFCSFSCYFHLKTSHGLFPDQCTICKMYFVPSPREDSPFLLLHNGKLNAFCSQSCQSHYIYKYQFLDTCSICRRPKSNFNMLKSNVDDVSSVQVKYCSMQCLQIVDQSTELRKAYFNSSPPNETSPPYCYY